MRHSQQNAAALLWATASGHMQAKRTRHAALLLDVGLSQQVVVLMSKVAKQLSAAQAICTPTCTVSQLLDLSMAVFKAQVVLTDTCCTAAELQLAHSFLPVLLVLFNKHWPCSG